MSLISDLQQAAINSDISVSDLLRKAFFVAKKLKHSEMESWATAELNGYGPDQEIPDYRRLKGEIKAHNHFQNAWIPIMSRHPEMIEQFSTMVFPAPLAELEAVVGSQPIVCTFQGEPERILMQSTVNQFGDPLNFKMALFITPGTMRGLIEKVRNQILEWSFKLEEQTKTSRTVERGLTENP